MDNWRPKDWKNPCQHGGWSADEKTYYEPSEAYEAGADAILGALRGSTEHLMRADVSEAVREYFKGSPLKRGVWVFIPD